MTRMPKRITQVNSSRQLLNRLAMTLGVVRTETHLFHQRQAEALAVLAERVKQIAETMAQETTKEIPLKALPMPKAKKRKKQK